jgi:hypothetical protein
MKGDVSTPLAQFASCQKFPDIVGTRLVVFVNQTIEKGLLSLVKLVVATLGSSLATKSFWGTI